MADIQQNISCPFKENEKGEAAVCLREVLLMDFLETLGASDFREKTCSTTEIKGVDCTAVRLCVH